MSRTNGVSPKLIAAVVTAIVTYLLGQQVLDVPDYAVVIGQAVLIALATFAAPPGDVTPPIVGVPNDTLLPKDPGA